MYPNQEGTLPIPTPPLVIITNVTNTFSERTPMTDVRGIQDF
jgi:hypothetical protein